MTTSGLSITRTPSQGFTEPVSLEELKLHLAIDFDDHDALLNILLKSAREEVEKYCGLSLIDTDVKVYWKRLTTRELPYGPVKSVTNEDDYKLDGLMGSFVSINSDGVDPVTVEYKAGYESVPESLKLAIMKLASDNFENRTGVIIEGARNMNDWCKTAAPFSRKTWFQ